MLTTCAALSLQEEPHASLIYTCKLNRRRRLELCNVLVSLEYRSVQCRFDLIALLNNMHCEP